MYITFNFVIAYDTIFPFNVLLVIMRDKLNLYESKLVFTIFVPQNLTLEKSLFLILIFIIIKFKLVFVIYFARKYSTYSFFVLLFL